jgi:hypothetical protein
VLTVHIGRSESEYLRIHARHRLYPDRTDPLDGNWIASTVEVAVGAFTARLDGNLRSEDFFDFRESLRRMLGLRRGEATLETMEEWLTIRLAATGGGHWEAVCELRDAPGAGNRLSFVVAVEDEPAMKLLFRTVDEIVTAFPVIH